MEPLSIGALTVLLAGVAFAADGTVVIVDDARLIGLCIVGSVLGAFLSIGLLPRSSNDLREYALKFGGSIIVGILVAPVAFRYSQITPDGDLVLCISGIISALSTVTLHKLIPFYERWLDAKLNDLTKDTK